MRLSDGDATCESVLSDPELKSIVLYIQSLK